MTDRTRTFINQANATAMRLWCEHGNLSFREILMHITRENLTPDKVSGPRYAAVIRQIYQGN